jgi:ribosomal protein S18 acetylase RimI-like enzyme
VTPVRRIRRGRPEDVPAVVELFQATHAWLVERGLVDPEPYAHGSGAVARIIEWEASGGLLLAEGDDGELLGALALGARPPYVTPAGEPERYIEALVRSRGHRGRGVGDALLREAAREARSGGAELLRVDVWGAVPALVTYFEQRGFERCGTYELDGGWHGQVLCLALDEPD